MFARDPVFPLVHLRRHGVTFLDWSHDTLSMESSLSHNCSATTVGSSVQQ